MTRKFLTERYLINREKLRYAACRRLHNATDTEDVLQDVFLKAWLHSDKLQSEEACDAWLMRICVNTCMDLQRKQGRRRETLVGQPCAADAADPARTAIDRLWLDALFQGLKAEARQAVLSYYLDGYTIREIAHRINRPEGTVKGLLHKTRKQMRHMADA